MAMVWVPQISIRETGPRREAMKDKSSKSFPESSREEKHSG